MAFRILTKEQMASQLKLLQNQGWIKSLRPLNSGGIGNTIDDRLGLTENNLPISDTAQWELKTQRLGTSSLLTLFHMDPQPRDEQVIKKLLLPMYGWDDRAGREKEFSFRQTLSAPHVTDRGFGIKVEKLKLLVYFDSSKVSSKHDSWLAGVKQKVGLGPLSVTPYWNLQDMYLKASTKMLNAFYIKAETKKENEDEYFRISSILMLQNFNLDKFIEAIDEGAVLIDFDARTHHNHGTKFRLKQDWIPQLYRFRDSV